MLYDPKWHTKEGWRKVLLAAADVIEQRGHCKHALERDGKVCMGGAINVVIFGDANTLRPHPDKEEAQRRLHDICGWPFVCFNNAKETTAAEVVAKMRECALAKG